MNKVNKIGIIGLGLIGGSIAVSARKKGAAAQIVAFNRTREPLENALADGVLDSYTTEIDDTFLGCDIIFVCVPVLSIMPYMEKLAGVVGKETVITDVGSTKASICKQMESYKDRLTFIGSHPMAGSERAGYKNAKGYLFENAYYIMTPYSDTPKDKLMLLNDFAQNIGAIPIVLDPEEHDYIVGVISHVPHVVAMSLVNAAKECTSSHQTAIQLASGGFKDITRIASSSPQMWQDICMDNSENILQILGAFKDAISDFERDIKADKVTGGGSVFGRFTSAKTFRDNMSSTVPATSMHVIRADAEDRPGVIALVATSFSYHNINIKNIGIANNREFEEGILEITVENDSDRQQGTKLLRANGFKVYE